MEELKKDMAALDLLVETDVQVEEPFSHRTALTALYCPLALAWLSSWQAV